MTRIWSCNFNIILSCRSKSCLYSSIKSEPIRLFHRNPIPQDGLLSFLRFQRPKYFDVHLLLSVQHRCLENKDWDIFQIDHGCNILPITKQDEQRPFQYDLLWAPTLDRLQDFLFLCEMQRCLEICQNLIVWENLPFRCHSNNAKYSGNDKNPIQQRNWYPLLFEYVLPIPGIPNPSFHPFPFFQNMDHIIDRQINIPPLRLDKYSFPFYTKEIDDNCKLIICFLCWNTFYCIISWDRFIKLFSFFLFKFLKNNV